MNVERLWDIRLRTPRLELRLPTEDELLQLFHTAEGGIHPPEEMPFYVPWTDELSFDSFAEFHRAAWSEWRLDKWDLNLIAFLGDAPIGSQGVGAANFAQRREIETGSWLGEPFQSRGLGTEQRAAVLELAFRGLDAVAAVSGSFAHNVKSQRVSERLGYRRTGTRTMESRGQPVEHFDYRLERAEWQSPVEVEITGLESALPLFGAA
jgi:RimJ/RimL family protein N-acetyltransferase